MTRRLDACIVARASCMGVAPAGEPHWRNLAEGRAPIGNGHAHGIDAPWVPGEGQRRPKA